MITAGCRTLQYIVILISAHVIHYRDSAAIRQLQFICHILEICCYMLVVHTVTFYAHYTVFYKKEKSLSQTNNEKNLQPIYYYLIGILYHYDTINDSCLSFSVFVFFSSSFEILYAHHVLLLYHQNHHWTQAPTQNFPVVLHIYQPSQRAL